MPSVQRAYKELPAKDVAVLTISLDGGDGKSVKKFLDENQYTMPAAHDLGMKVGRMFNARGVPMTYVVDRRNNIVASGIGPVDFDQPAFRRLIQFLVAQPRS